MPQARVPQREQPAERRETGYSLDEEDDLDEENATQKFDDLRKLVECQKCRKNRAVVMLFPCSHIASCAGCQETLEECPKCGHHISDKVGVIFG